MHRHRALDRGEIGVCTELEIFSVLTRQGRWKTSHFKISGGIPRRVFLSSKKN